MERFMYIQFRLRCAISINCRFHSILYSFRVICEIAYSVWPNPLVSVIFRNTDYSSRLGDFRGTYAL